MKKKLFSRIVCIMLAVIMVLSVMPQIVFASGKTIIKDMELEFNPKRLPKAGDDVRIYGDEILSDGSGTPYTVNGGNGVWYSDIPNGYDNDTVRHFYEINDSNQTEHYSFEKGKTYLFRLICTIKTDFKDTHDFYTWEDADKTNITFTNLSPSQYEIFEVEASPGYMRIYFAFTVDGECTYDDITDVYAKWDDFYAYPPRADRQIGFIAFSYGNFSYSRKWEGEFNTTYGGALMAKAGEHYKYTVTLNARDGYKFSSDVKFHFDKEEPDSIELSSDRKTLKVVFEYDVSDVVYIDNIELNNQIDEYLLVNASGGLTDCYQLQVPASEPYYEYESTDWLDESGNAKTELASGEMLYFEETFRVRNVAEHKFSENVTVTISGLPEGSYTALLKEYSEELVTFYIIIHEGYRNNVGKTEDKPIRVSSYFGLKWALENPQIRYIEIGDIEETLPLIKKEEGKENFFNGITVNNTKNLKLTGEAEFSAIEVDETAYAIYDNLIEVPSGSILNVSGEGSLAYKGYHYDCDNAPIYVCFGTFTLTDATITGKATKSGTYAPAVASMYGNVTIKSGTLNGSNNSDFENAALVAFGGDLLIQGGRFETMGSGIKYGLRILTKNTRAVIEKGTFYSKGIKLPEDSMYLSSYVTGARTVKIGNSTTYEPYEVNQQMIDSSYVVPLRVCEDVSKAYATVKIPVAGNTVDTSPSISEGLNIVSVKWYANNSAIPMASSGTHQINSTYKVVITVATDELYVFGKSTFTGRVNGKEATVKAVTEGYEITYSFGQCKNALTEIHLGGLTMPKNYDNPDRSFYADGDTEGKINISKISWYEDEVLMESDDLFTAGKVHTLEIIISAGTNYIFNVDTEGEPLLDCDISGLKAYTKGCEGFSGTRYATLVVEFGTLCSSVIDNISLTVTEPVAGMTPEYYAIAHGSFNVDTTKEAYYEELVGSNAVLRYYHLRRGVSWYDETAGKTVYENEAFIAGHEYSVSIYVIPCDGLEFLYKQIPFGDDLVLSAEVNGIQANVAELGIFGGTDKQYIYCTFTCEPAVIRDVEIIDFNMPVAGQSPDYNYTLGSELYQMKTDFGTDSTGVEWYTGAGDLMTPHDTFIDGENYFVRLRVAPVNIDGNNMCKFYNGTSVTVNGTKVKENFGNLINRNTNWVELFYYMTATSEAVTKEGWMLEGNNWYFYENGEPVKDEWRKDSAGWCYLLSDGSMATNMWIQDSKGWCYVGSDGYCLTNCWAQDSVGWVWLDSEGSMVYSQWIYYNNKWYYIDYDGYMASNTWRKDSVGWCYLLSDGSMATNMWIQDSKGWCYVGSDGYCLTDCWAQDSAGWVWLDSEGSMVYNQWIWYDSAWYYIGSNGYMLCNTSQYIDGKTYNFNSSGVCTNP